MITTLPEPASSLPPPRHSGRADGLRDFARAVTALYDWQGATSLLDVGAGDAWFRDFLASSWRYVSVDINAFGAQVIADAHALPFRDRDFDVVVSKQTLPHFADPARACIEMLRVARCLVIIRQEFPEPVGWLGHSRVRIDRWQDIAEILAIGGVVSYDGTDFVVRKDSRGGEDRASLAAEEV